MPQHQAAVAGKIDIDHLDIGIEEPDVMLPCQFASNPTIAPLVVNGVYPDAGTLLRLVMEMKHSHFPDQPGAEKLTDETFVTVIGPDITQYRHRIAGSGNFGKPVAILAVRNGDDTLDVLHDREAERIGIEARKARIVEIGLKYHVCVRLQKFKEIAVGDPPL